MDSAEGFFSPAIVLRDQLFERVSVGSRHYAEKRLMVAVLRDAVGIFQRHVHTASGSGERMFQEVEKWFCSNDHSWPFSFENICNTLDIHPLYLRRALKLSRKGLRNSPQSRRGYRTNRATVHQSAAEVPIKRRTFGIELQVRADRRYW